jgi:hypothetical protein
MSDQSSRAVSQFVAILREAIANQRAAVAALSQAQRPERVRRLCSVCGARTEQTAVYYAGVASYTCTRCLHRDLDETA